MLLLHVFSSLWHVEDKGIIAIHTAAITEQTSGRNGGPGGSTENELNQLLAEKWDRNAPYDSIMFFKSHAPQF